MRLNSKLNSWSWIRQTYWGWGYFFGFWSYPQLHCKAAQSFQRCSRPSCKNPSVSAVGQFLRHLCKSRTAEWPPWFFLEIEPPLQVILLWSSLFSTFCFLITSKLLRPTNLGSMLHVYISYLETKQRSRTGSSRLICQKQYKETVLLGLHTLKVMVSGQHWSESVSLFVKREGGQQR